MNCNILQFCCALPKFFFFLNKAGTVLRVLRLLKVYLRMYEIVMRRQMWNHKSSPIFFFTR